MTDTTGEIRAVVEALASTWWQPRTGNERQSFGGRCSDLAAELGRYLDLQDACGGVIDWPHLFGAAAAIYRDPGRPWGLQGEPRVTKATFDRFSVDAEAIAEAVFRRPLAQARPQERAAPPPEARRRA